MEKLRHLWEDRAKVGVNLSCNFSVHVKMVYIHAGGVLLSEVDVNAPLHQNAIFSAI